MQKKKKTTHTGIMGFLSVEEIIQVFFSCHEIYSKNNDYIGNSAYLFLVIAEVLALELRKNNKIQGILINEIEKILGQFADNMDLYLLNDGNSITEAINTIDNFEKNSGFKINYDKTALYRIGLAKNSIATHYVKHKVKWSNDDMSILGVTITHDQHTVMTKNYGNILNKVTAVLNMWKRHNLLLIGKVLIINSLTASLFTYKMLVLPCIDRIVIDKYEKIIENFLWNGRKAKITSKVLQLNKIDGGLALVNLDLKDKALKINWVRWINEDELLQELAYRKLDQHLRHEIWVCKICPSNVEKVFQKSFWRDVLKCWAELHFQDEVESFEDCMKQCMRYNSHIRIRNLPFIFKLPCRDGLMYVCQ